MHVADKKTCTLSDLSHTAAVQQTLKVSPASLGMCRKAGDWPGAFVLDDMDALLLAYHALCQQFRSD